MTDRTVLRDAVKKIAWAYILLHLAINLGTVDVLPDWLGYVLILGTLPAISAEEVSAKLLRPLAAALAVWYGFRWVLQIVEESVNLEVLSILVTVVGLYFHFQLHTNLADIAQKYHCPERQKLLTLRSVRTVLCTVMALPMIPWDTYEWLAAVLLAVQLVVVLWSCAVLFSLHKSLDTGNLGEE